MLPVHRLGPISRGVRGMNDPIDQKPRVVAGMVITFIFVWDIFFFSSRLFLEASISTDCFGEGFCRSSMFASWLKFVGELLWLSKLMHGKRACRICLRNVIELSYIQYLVMTMMI